MSTSDVLKEFISDVEAVGPRQVGHDWPDLLITYNKARRVLKEEPEPVISPKQHNLLLEVRDELRRMGLGTQWEVDGADAVDYLALLYRDVKKVLRQPKKGKK